MLGKFSCKLPMALAATLILASLGMGASQAGDNHDHDRARRALEAGEILPLRTILERVEHDHPGRVMEVDLERKDTGWRYEIKLLRGDGALIKLKIDARDGTVLGIKEKNDKSIPLEKGR
ncbi:MAG: PepSY domain-containing protein [Nitrosomonadales bacterium]|nr:PepSY domain-containing protein [Nitrosomonadales bacterium]